MRTSPLGYALLVLVLGTRALASSDFEAYEAYVQPDVLRVRASASADATLLTRLPINYPVLVVGAPSAEGFGADCVVRRDQPIEACLEP